MESTFCVRTAVIERPLAYQMRRLAAARASKSGLQILTLPQMAARLAGGFTYPVTAEQMEPGIQIALDEGGFAELDHVRELPGMTRAVARALRKAWDADIDLAEIEGERVHDLALIEERMKARFPSAAMTPRDLRNAALARVDRAAALLGPVRIERLSYVAPVWRPLLNALRHVVAVAWEAPSAADTAWFEGVVEPLAKSESAVEWVRVSCADPHHEVIEALRWVRELISVGRAKPSDIAIATASTAPWDDHFLALASDAGVRLHFSHGIPALSTRDGQRCAALVDVLLRGLSNERVRRLVSLCLGQGCAVDRLPENWLSVLPRGATLPTLADWQRALDAAKRTLPMFDTGNTLLPFLALLAKGPMGANEAAEALLRGRSLRIWQAATRTAPAHALELTLRQTRLPDETDAGDSVAWCSAADLAVAPRPWVRLLGLTSHAWPRRLADDPILPNHVVPAVVLDPDPVEKADRRHFTVITNAVSGGLVLSRARRNAQGGRVGPSPLLAQSSAERSLSRARIPEHAFSEADRLMARPEEAAEVERIKSASRCWHNWHREGLTAHDGNFNAEHVVIRRALERIQSPTSLQRLLRDPLGFVWKYGLGWGAPQEREQPLTIAADEFGKLVHELLRRAVDALEPAPGYEAASKGEIEAALRAAAEIVRETWPLERPVPPRLLWSNTVDHGTRMALSGLLLKEISEPGTRSWTELPFGQAGGLHAAGDLPWDRTVPIEVPGTPIRIQGTIDRLDLRSTGFAVRVTDYKTGQRPKNLNGIVIAGGRELQRALYALACRQLLPGPPRVVARLVYLIDEPLVLPLQNLDDALAQISEFVRLAYATLQRGVAVPGRDVYLPYNDLRLALPASPGYERRKRAEFAKAASPLSNFWSAR
jgi:RecB family exonuclease